MSRAASPAMRGQGPETAPFRLAPGRWLPLPARRAAWPGRRRLVEMALPAVGVALGGLGWWAAAAWLVPASSFLARFAPDRALASLIDLVATGALWPHLVT